MTITFQEIAKHKAAVALQASEGAAGRQTAVDTATTVVVLGWCL